MGELDRELVVPIAMIASLVRLQSHFTAGLQLRPFHGDGERVGRELAGRSLNLLQHQPPRFRFHSRGGSAGHIAEHDADAINALRDSDRKGEWLVTRDEPIAQAVRTVALDGRDRCTFLKSMPDSAVNAASERTAMYPGATLEPKSSFHVV